MFVRNILSFLSNVISISYKGGNMDKRVIKFLVFTFLLTFGCWGAIILANQFEYLVYGTPISMIIYLTGGLSPTIVAYFYLKKCNRVDGIKDFF